MKMAGLPVEKCAQELVASLDRERAQYEELARLAEETRCATGKDDTAAFTELLEKKRHVQRELRQISTVTRSLRRDFEQYDDVQDDVKATVSAALDRTRDALAKVLRAVRASEESFHAIRDLLQAELAEIARGRHLLEAYRAGGGDEPRFMDKRK